MKIWTIEELSSFLDSDIVWRKKELALLKSIAASDNLKLRQDVIVRSGVALLYAHWEGFIKSSSCAYLDYISKRRLPYERLKSNFVAIKIRHMIGDVSLFNKFNKRKEIVDFIRTGLNESCILSSNTINTQSNLSSEVLREIISILDLDYSPFVTKEKLIDEQLVSNRNNIAHGRYLLMDLHDYFDLEKEILVLLSIFKDQIDNAAYLKSYLRN